MKRFIVVLGLILPSASPAFDSGSTGVDGAFNPTADIQLQLPPSGIFNFTTIDIPQGVTVTFAKNAANTPAILLASGDVTVAGAITLNGGATAQTSDSDPTGDGLPGIGGVGGFDGGHGGYSSADNDGGYGQGPGGGKPGKTDLDSRSCGGAGAGYNGIGGTNSATVCVSSGQGGGSAYGSPALMPLIGGSGGGGGAGISTVFGSGGGGGGGAILIASSGTISVSGLIQANGGPTGFTDHPTLLRCAGSGGGGSGGAIRLVATTISGTGTLSAQGNGPSRSSRYYSFCDGGRGAPGRIRLEAETMQFSAQSSPPFSFAGPSPVFVPNLPAISFSSIAGIAVGAAGSDLILPENTANPIAIELATSGIPQGSIINVTATPIAGDPVTADSTATAADGSASLSIDLPSGPSLLIASTTFVVTASAGLEYSKYAQGEPVEKIRVGAHADGYSETTFITASGKEYTWPAQAVVMN